jgi:hypothetical protein
MARAKEKTGELTERALERSRELKSQMGESIERNPFVLGSLFFALGSAIGFLFPRMAAPLVEKAAPLMEKMGTNLGMEPETSGSGQEEPMETMETESEETATIHSELETGGTGRSGATSDRKFPEEA